MAHHQQALGPVSEHRCSPSHHARLTSPPRRVPARLLGCVVSLQLFVKSDWRPPRTASILESDQSTFTATVSKRTNSLSPTFLGDDLTRTSEINPVFSCSAVGEPAFSFCVCEGRREFRAVQRHISHGYLVNPSAIHRRARFCTCGNQRL
jgi:hypothetical protein